MKQVRAFSDTEIVTIAAVAASALGGIVIGLGRGQENSSASLNETSLVQSTLSRARATSSSIVPSFPQSEVSLDTGAFRDAAQAAKQSSVSAAKRAVQNLDAAPALSRAKRRVPVGRPSSHSSFTDHLKVLGKQILDTSMSDAPRVDFQALRDEGVQMLGQLFGGPTSDAEAAPVDDIGLRAKVADRLETIEQEVSAAPDAVMAAKNRSQAVVRERVASPIARTFGSTSDAAKESATALVWLGLGTAVVYFGLLSADRREQVKAALCGVVEQTRLLMLDLQGYEPEM